MSKLPIEYILPLMSKIGLTKEINGGYNPISKTAFNKLADAHRYGSLYVFYFGHARENCFAFYPPQTTKKEALDIAYGYYLDCFTEMKQEFVDGNVCWGNWGIPITYGDPRVNVDWMNELIEGLKPKPFVFYLGSAKVETLFLNELREVVEEIKSGNLSNKVTDFIYSVETGYQQHYELDENNFEIVHN